MMRKEREWRREVLGLLVWNQNGWILSTPVFSKEKRRSWRQGGLWMMDDEQSTIE